MDKLIITVAPHAPSAQLDAYPDLPRTPEQIAGEVVRSLGVTLAVTTTAPQASAPTEDMTAYHAYLRGKEILDVEARKKASFAGADY